MKNLINKLIRLLCVSVIGMLGFSSCEEHSDEYGTPITNFRYWGIVTDEAGNPIEGINVIMSGNILGMPNVKLKTESYDGEKYNFSTGIFSTADTHIATIDFVDVDGEENGGDFQSVTITPQDMVQESQFDDMPATRLEYKATIKLKKK
mgnify:FL=1